MATVPYVADREAPADVTRELYERYGGQIFVFCLSQLGSREEAEDAVQSTFLNAFRGLSRGIAPVSESAWLFKIAHNVCLTRRRAIWRRGRVETAQDVEALQGLVPAPAPVDADELIALEEALAAMRERQRTAILLREWQGLSYREIGEAMGMSQPAVEALIFRARRSLAWHLEEPPKAPRLARLRHALDAGWLAAALKALLGGGAAAKAVVTAAAVTTAGVVAAGQLTAEPERTARVPERAVPALQDRAAVVSAPRASVQRASRPVVAAKRPVERRSTPRPAAPKQKRRPPARRAAKPVVALPTREHAAPQPKPKAAKPKPSASERRGGTSNAPHGNAKGHVKQKQRPALPAAVEKKPNDKGPEPSRAERGRSQEAKNPGSNKPVESPPTQPEASPPAPPPSAAGDASAADAGQGRGKEKDEDATG